MHVSKADYKPKFDLFWTFLPKQYIEKVVLVETNKNLQVELKLGKYTRWLGIVFLMSTVCGYHCHEFWSIKQIDTFQGPPYCFGM